MSNFGPPTIFPPVPINEPGNGPQGVTLQKGVPTLQVTTSKFSYASPAAEPIGLPTVFVPPVTFQQS